MMMYPYKKSISLFMMAHGYLLAGTVSAYPGENRRVQPNPPSCLSSLDDAAMKWLKANPEDAFESLSTHNSDPVMHAFENSGACERTDSPSLQPENIENFIYSYPSLTLYCIEQKHPSEAQKAFIGHKRRLKRRTIKIQEDDPSIAALAKMPSESRKEPRISIQLTPEEANRLPSFERQKSRKSAEHRLKGPAENDSDPQISDSPNIKSDDELKTPSSSHESYEEIDPFSTDAPSNFRKPPPNALRKPLKIETRPQSTQPQRHNSAPMSAGSWLGQLSPFATRPNSFEALEALSADDSTPSLMEQIPICGHIISAIEYSKGNVAKARRASMSATAGLIPPILCANLVCAGSPSWSTRARSLSSPRLPSSEVFNDRSEWMEDYHEQTIFDLYLPGTHNSGAYALKFGFTEQKNLLEVLIGEAFHMWVTCQKLDIYQQLVVGVRVLDLRVATIKEKTVIAHRIPTILLSVALHDIRKFVSEHPSEVVVVQMKRDWDNEVDWTQVARLFAHYLGDLAVPESMALAPIGDIVNSGRNVIIINNRTNAMPEEIFNTAWQPTRIEGKWYNTNIAQELKEKLQHDLEALRRGKDQFIGTTAVMTANITVYTQKMGADFGASFDLYFRSKNGNRRNGVCDRWDSNLHMAEAANHILHDLLNSYADNGRAPNLNVIDFDYVQDEILERIISFNERLLDE